MENKYRVLLNPRAFRDLDEIYQYIALENLAPESAKKQTERIRSALQNLEYFPYAHQQRLEGRFAGKGYRQLVVDHYIAVYRIDEKNKIVRIITIQYCGRNF